MAVGKNVPEAENSAQPSSQPLRVVRISGTQWERIAWLLDEGVLGCANVPEAVRFFVEHGIQHYVDRHLAHQDRDEPAPDE